MRSGEVQDCRRSGLLAVFLKSAQRRGDEDHIDRDRVSAPKAGVIDGTYKLREAIDKVSGIRE